MCEAGEEHLGTAPKVSTKGADRQAAIGRAGLKPAAGRAGISENAAARGHGDWRPRPL